MKTIAVCGYKISQSTVYARLKTTFIAMFKFIIFSITYIKSKDSKVVQSADIGETTIFFLKNSALDLQQTVLTIKSILHYSV